MAKTKAQSKPLPKVPLLDDQPGYKAAREKMDHICREHREIEDEISELLAKVKDAKPYNRTEAEAAAILNGGEPEEDSLPAIRGRIGRLQRKSQAFEEAKKQQQVVIRDAVGKADFELQSQFRELYQPMVEKTRQAVLDLVACLDEERRFKAVLEGQGFSLRPPIDTPSRQCFGQLTSDWRGPVAKYLRVIEQNYDLKTPGEYLP